MIKIVQGTVNVPEDARSMMYPTGRLNARLGAGAMLYSDELLSQSHVHLSVGVHLVPCSIYVDPCGGIGYIWEYNDSQGRLEAIRLWEEFLRELEQNL